MKQDIKEMVINLILETVEKKSAMPWDAGFAGKMDFGVPINYQSREKYKGINRILLSILGDGTGEYLTFNLCNKLGGKVNKGEKSLPIVFYSLYNKTQKRPADKKIDLKTDEIVPILRSYKVFEVSQTTLKPKRELVRVENEKDMSIEEFIKIFFDKTNLKLQDKIGIASYSPSQHRVSISDISLYKNSEEYYATLFHEMIHSTGEAMKRDLKNSFGKEKYSKEEVIAEFGAMFLCERFGIKKTQPNSAAYIKNWSDKLRENPNWLISGANAAERAVDYILEITGLSESQKETDQNEVNKIAI